MDNVTTEKIKKAFDSFLNEEMEPLLYGRAEHEDFKEGVIVVLNILNLKVEGVNK